VRVGIYARVSTAGNGQSPEMQLRELREYVERRGWTLAGEYVDEGISGAKDSRPELNRLVEDAHRRKFDCVLVWKFDRFARSVSHLLRALGLLPRSTYADVLQSGIFAVQQLEMLSSWR